MLTKPEYTCDYFARRCLARCRRAAAPRAKRAARLLPPQRENGPQRQASDYSVIIIRALKTGLSITLKLKAVTSLLKCRVNFCLNCRLQLCKSRQVVNNQLAGLRAPLSSLRLSRSTCCKQVEPGGTRQ